ncbi:hypothetical protein NIES4101_71920 [Calothrix sp. NIES-4101]|nr:hypothetical protein NIES4101_71920 [Calothrix sp. NIES-4101]
MFLFGNGVLNISQLELIMIGSELIAEVTKPLNHKQQIIN